MPYTARLLGSDYVYCMRKLGLIAAIAGFGILAAGILLRVLTNPNSWLLWLPGSLLLAAGSALILWSVWVKPSVALRIPKSTAVPGTDTARLLDNFEQRFAELKGRKPNATVLGELYTLASQLEQRGRAPQATAVYRHLARFDNSYRDVSVRLRRLMDAERNKPKAAAAPNAASPAGADATTPNLRALLDKNAPL